MSARGGKPIPNGQVHDQTGTLALLSFLSSRALPQSVLLSHLVLLSLRNILLAFLGLNKLDLISSPGHIFLLLLKNVLLTLLVMNKLDLTTSPGK